MIIKTIRYELLNNFKATLQERDSIFSDLKTTIQLSFLLPERFKEKHLNYVIELQKDDIKETHELIDMQFTLPRYLYTQGCLLVTVYALDKGEILYKWNCEPLIINAFGERVRSMIEFVPDIYHLSNLYSELVEQNADLNATIATQTEEIRELNKFKELTANELLKAQQAIVALQNKIDGLIQEINI